MDVVIVDDEPLARERLRRMIDNFPGYAVAGEAGDGAAAVAVARESHADIVLLDIHMPGMDGLQVARALAEAPVPPAVIFVTAHVEHALSAHDTAVAGYLLKPIRRDALATALERARRPSRAQLRALAGTDIDAEPAYISARTRDRHERVAVNDVIYFWADRKYTSVYHMHGELLIEASLLNLQERLGEAFLRVHRKALVAHRHITGLQVDDDGHARITLRHCSEDVPVSRRRLTEVRHLLSAQE